LEGVLPTFWSRRDVREISSPPLRIVGADLANLVNEAAIVVDPAQRRSGDARRLHGGDRSKRLAFPHDHISGRPLIRAPRVSERVMTLATVE
jgi:hypothetical protein